MDEPLAAVVLEGTPDDLMLMRMLPALVPGVTRVLLVFVQEVPRNQPLETCTESQMRAARKIFSEMRVLAETACMEADERLVLARGVEAGLQSVLEEDLPDWLLMRWQAEKKRVFSDDTLSVFQHAACRVIFLK